MVLRISETGLQLESSAKSADTLPLQAFAITLSDSLIEDLIQCSQNGEDIKLSLGNVPVGDLLSYCSEGGEMAIGRIAGGVYCSACRQ